MVKSPATQLYSIGEAVAELQRAYPDVTHSSLRFLQREGLVEPVRTPGGHRKYRPEDLERLRCIKEWQAERLSLEEIRQRIRRLERMPKPDDLWPRFLELALEGRFHQATAIVLGADEVGMPLAHIFQEILMPAMIEVGHRWADGSLKVGQEHEVTELCRDIVSELTMRHMRQAAEGMVVLAAAVENELHDLGLRMVCGLLRQQGVQVHFLGPSVGTRFLVESVQMRRPDVVLISITLAEHWPSLEGVLRVLRQEFPDAVAPVVIVGGQAGARGAEAFTGPGIRVMPPDSLMSAVDEILSLRQTSGR